MQTAKDDHVTDDGSYHKSKGYSILHLALWSVTLQSAIDESCGVGAASTSVFIGLRLALRFLFAEEQYRCTPLRLELFLVGLKPVKWLLLCASACDEEWA